MCVCVCVCFHSNVDFGFTTDLPSHSRYASAQAHPLDHRPAPTRLTGPGVRVRVRVRVRVGVRDRVTVSV